ncbi:hypothetical protein [Nocardioides marmoribigeumensis]|jgi:hypothetical protein|uniref:Uncharacterized protein n=1 Tax=Nocardioides marmoribigeumensis TaxID=433649 RepID=A0ABU2C1W5_9ACTN|nr:hypothetical protein [Nocardioides marmoribigeumensis]MDR7364664.1 hypothetical protein [Nocardioides marmoribigeumensis]
MSAVDDLAAALAADPSCWEELASYEDRGAFAFRLARLAPSYGVEVTREEVLDALVVRRREWLSRWV